MNRYRWTIVTPIKKLIICTPESSGGFSMGEHSCDVRIFLPSPVRVEGEKLLCGDDVFICSPDGISHQAVIRPKRVLVAVSEDKSIEYFRISMERITDAPNAWDRALLLKTGTYSFGTTDSCNVVYPAVGDIVANEFSINYYENKITLCADHVMFGIYHNQRKVKPGQTVELHEGDFVYSGAASLYCGGNVLLTTPQTIVKGLEYHDSSEGSSHLVYPCMQRTARAHIDIPCEEIEVLDPPQLPEDRNENIFFTILPTLVSILLIIMLRSNNVGGSNMILYSVATMALGLLTSFATFITEQKSQSKKSTEREKNYRKYIDDISESIQIRRRLECEKLNSIYTAPQKELRNVESFSASLFDRVPSDADFLDIRLGSGQIRSGEQVKCRQHECFEAMDALFYEPVRLRDEFAYIDNMPVVLHACKSNAIGILGNRNALREMMRICTLDVAARHSDLDVKLFYLVSSALADEMNAIRFLPHIKDKVSGGRNIALSGEGYDEVLENLCRILAQREADKKECENAPWIVIHVESDQEILQHPLMKYIPFASELHAGFFFWASEREYIPLGCKYEVRLFTNVQKGLLRCLEKEAEDSIFTYDCVSQAQMAAVSYKLAPVYTGEISLGNNLRESCTFYEALGITEAKSENILRNWREADIRKSLAVPIGVAAGDEPVYLDLHEKAHGPHGLVAGTTGSGKSELILCYLLSLMYYYSPDEVNIVIIDFKGGGMGRQLQGLPHLTGMITNLEKYEIDRSLSSIKAELVRRQKLLADAKVSNISDYYTARGKRPELPPLPHLMLVADEFAELKQQQPDFMAELISAARIGRSLGVHLILSTQKPAGVIDDQIQGNMDFVICLRVQSKSDSSEVLGSPLAAEIREPGRAYLKVGRCGMFELLQSGYSGAPIDVDTAPKISIDKVTVTGRRESLYRTVVKKNDVEDNKQFAAVKKAIIAAFDASGKQLPGSICLPSLEKLVSHPGVKSGSAYQLPIALIDDPANQAQYSYMLDISGSSTIITGSPQSGATTLLQTMLMAAAEKLTAEQLNVYIMDFNSGLFKTMERLAIVGGVVGLDDEESIKNLLKMLRYEIARRKGILLDAEVVSFAKYLEAGFEDLPAIALFIDNFAVFKEIYDEKYGAELQFILREGPAVGITATITCNQVLALGYRRLCYFSRRIALYNADPGELSSTLEGGHSLVLPEIPGRMLIKQDKRILTAQAYMYYADKEPQIRASKLHEFMDLHSSDRKARAIPSIPILLSAEVLNNICGDRLTQSSFAYAMEFSNVEPVIMDLYKQFEWSLISASADNVRSFVTLLADSASKLAGGMHMHIIDNYDRSLQDVVKDADYSLDADAATELVQNICGIAEKRRELTKENGMAAIANEPLEIAVINSAEAIKLFGDDDETWTMFTRTEERMSAMRILFIFADIPNRSVSYSSPELYKHVRDNRKACIFETASKIAFFDTNISEINANNQQLGRSDAISYGDNGMTRIRMARV